MGADDAEPHFHDKESEVRHWKSRYYDLQDTLKETEASLHEFMESSKDLEKEMDREISAANTKSNELQLKSEKLKGDVDEWKSKYQRALTDHNKTLAELNRELSMLRESHTIYKNQMRDLELNNDELENAERMVASSLNDMESRYNKAIERTALLEEELLEKSRLEEENQRLKDELQEANEELAVLRESLSSSRLTSRTVTPAQPSSSTGRSSVDDLQLSDLTSRPRPLSRSSVRPASRNGMKNSPPLPRATLPSIASSGRVKSLASSRAERSSADETTSSGMVTSPSSHAIRSRQSVGPSSFRTSVRAPRYTSTFTGTRSQPTASKTMIGDMFQRMRALEKRLADTRNGVAVNDVQSAIPRPSSRLGSSIGPGGNTSVNLTPRRSVDVRREDAGTPSSIPVPLNKSLNRRPTSRLSTAPGTDSAHIPASHLPSSLRCQTPTFESGATLDFLDQDPAKLRRRSHLTMGSASFTTATSAPPVSLYRSSESNRPRGSTVTMGLSRGESLRKSANPGTGRPAPPVSWKPGQSISRPRSGSVEYK